MSGLCCGAYDFVESSFVKVHPEAGRTISFPVFAHPHTRTTTEVSRVIEKLLKAANEFQVRVFFDRLSGKYGEMARDRCASHVLQALLGILPALLQVGCLAWLEAVLSKMSTWVLVW